MDCAFIIIIRLSLELSWIHALIVAIMIAPATHTHSHSHSHSYTHTHAQVLIATGVSDPKKFIDDILEQVCYIMVL